MAASKADDPMAAQHVLTYLNSTSNPKLRFNISREEFNLIALGFIHSLAFMVLIRHPQWRTDAVLLDIILA